MSAAVSSAVVSPTRAATAESRRLVFFFLLLALLLASAPALAEGVAATDFRGQRIELDKPAARKIVYGMDYGEWRDKYQTEASAEQKAAFEAANREH